MFKKYLVIASKKDLAGVNITTQLSQFRKNPLLSSMKKDGVSFDFYLIEDEIIHTKNLDLSKINQYDFVIFASKHESKNKEKTLSIHAPGNWSIANLGGESEKICPTSALFSKQLFENIISNAREFKLNNYKITLEATHHGPLIEKPCLFLEIGSTPTEWKDNRAGFFLAKVLSETIETFEPSKYREVAFGIGGNHYCPTFNKLQEKSNIAISHVIPQYMLPLTQRMIDEAKRKTLEDIDFVVIDWKGCGNSESREQVVDMLEKNYISWKKTSEIK